MDHSKKWEDSETPAEEKPVIDIYLHKNKAHCRHGNVLNLKMQDAQVTITSYPASFLSFYLSYFLALAVTCVLQPF